MTRLLQLLIPTVSIGLLWLALITGIVPVTLTESWWHVILPLPVYFVVSFGCYALANVGYNVYCVRSDDKALEDLQQDIKNAKQDLKKKGFQFDM